MRARIKDVLAIFFSFVKYVFCILESIRHLPNNKTVFATQFYAEFLRIIVYADIYFAPVANQDKVIG